MAAMTRLLSRLHLAWILGALLAGAGCARTGDDTLVILSDWPPSERAALASEFEKWSSASPNPGGATRIVWVCPADGCDPSRLLERRVPADLLLGGPPSVYERLAAEDRLLAGEPEDGTGWRIARRSPLGLASRKGQRDTHEAIPAALRLGDPSMKDQAALDDPRSSPVALAWAKDRLAFRSWADGYAELVRTAANARAIGPGPAMMRLEHDPSVSVPATLRQVEASPPPGAAFAPLPGGPECLEGAGVLAEARHPEKARAFLRFLEERAGPSTAPERPPAHPGADELLAEMLGATTVDAQEELRAAWDAVVRAGRPAEWEGRLTEAPPWPPASVAKMQSLPDEAPYVDTLAEQIAPEFDLRAWLLVSWDRPRKPIDGAALDELAGAVEGRLMREPRFRAWLRGEWTAWARQRYRWIAREAGRPAA
jgi:hypothetical protein